MPLKQPTSMDECVYFTRRVTGNGKAKVWVFKEKCPKCNNGTMGKPKNSKTGKPKIRAKEYVCTICNYTVDEKSYEDTLTASIEYTCPYCANEGEIQIPFKRKKVQIFNETVQKKKAADSLRFQCQKCSKNIDITKKMK